MPVPTAFLILPTSFTGGISPIYCLRFCHLCRVFHVATSGIAVIFAPRIGYPYHSAGRRHRNRPRFRFLIMRFVLRLPKHGLTKPHTTTLHLRRQGPIRNQGHVATSKACLCVIFTFRESNFLCQRPCVVPCKIRVCIVAQRFQDKGKKLCCSCFIICAKGGFRCSGSQPLSIGISYPVFGPIVHIRKRGLPSTLR